MSEPPSFPPPAPYGAPPSYPAAPPSPGAPPPSAYPGVAGGPPPTPPATVTGAFTAMLVRSALSVVSLIVTLGSRDQLRARLVRQQARLRSPNQLDVDRLVTIGLAIGVAVGLVILVLYVVLAFQVRRGRQWARVVTWVVAGFGVLGLLTQFLVSATPLTHVIGTATGLLDLVVIVLLARRPTSEYVTAVRQHRRGW